MAPDRDIRPVILRRGKKGKDVASFGQLRDWYDSLQRSHEALQKECKLLRATASGDRKDLVETRTNLKTAKTELLQISRSQKSSDEAKKAAVWGGSAGIVVAIWLEMMAVPSVGYFGGAQMEPVWTHSATQSALIWLVSIALSLAYKLVHDEL